MINVRNAPDLSGATLYGGYSASGPISNNILNWYSKDVTVQNIVNFAKLNFYLPDNITAGDTLLTIADKNNADTDLKGSTITITTTAASTGFNLGDSLYLINKTDSGTLLTDATTVSCNVIKGVSLQSLHEVELTNAENKLTATLISTKKTTNCCHKPNLSVKARPQYQVLSTAAQILSAIVSAKLQRKLLSRAGLLFPLQVWRVVKTVMKQAAMLMCTAGTLLLV
ncbi:MAG: hypothetical protein LUC29_05850 [Acidaminococcaceae bacterium]|nr:hypothetical protein [Acidaminococcaceae bacterium]